MEQNYTPLPLVIEAQGPAPDLITWIGENRTDFDRMLTKHGAILLRGFDIRSAEAFQTFMKCFNTEPLPYMFRSSPRKELDASIKNIFLSTSYPQSRHIN